MNALARRLPYLAHAALIAAGYFAVARLSLLLAIPPGYATPVWPSSGIALAAALLCGNRIWPGIWLGAALANVSVEASLPSALLIGSGNTLEALVGAALIRRFVHDPAHFRRADEVFAFIATCAASAVIAASTALLPLLYGHSLTLAQAWRNWWTWWQGDFAGMLIVAPLLLSWSAAGALPWEGGKRLEAACFFLLLLASAIGISYHGGSHFAPYSLTFLSLPFIIWAAFRFGQREATATIGVICAVAVWYTVRRSGEFADVPLNELLLQLVAFVSIVVATGLVLVAVVDERSRVTVRLRAREVELEAQLQRSSHYDALTGLANAALFRERLAQLLELAGENRCKVAVGVMDIERFKVLNDTLGRTAGDELLKQVAARLKGDASNTTIIARIGGDRFAIAGYGFRSESAVARTVEARLAQWFGPAYRSADGELKLSARAGLALYPDDATTVDAIYMHAESALKKAKATGERYLFYAQAMSRRVADTLSLENKLRLAIEREEFVLYYQPKVDLDTRRIVGMEALIRWNSPELGLVSPIDFIPLLEESGMIREVGSWALRRARQDQASWIAGGFKVPRIAVNVSPVQLRQRDFVERVRQEVSPAGASSRIDLEVTESCIMEDIEANIEKLSRIRALDIGVAIDDFGTGYSSLAYLMRLPVQTLKIDRFFIHKMLEDDQSMALVQTIIALAQSLKLTTVAEGVETEAQADVLEMLRCDQMQGYLVSRPLPAERIPGLLESARLGD